MANPLARPRRRRQLACLVVLALLVAAAVWTHQRVDREHYLTVAGMRGLVEAYHPYGPLIFIAACVVGIVLRFPVLLIALGGIVFERPHAIAYAWVASVVGTTSTFILVRYFARDALARSFANRFAGLRALNDRLERHGFVVVLGLRLLLFLAAPLNWAIGATRVRLGQYVAGTALGVIPGIAVTTFLADAIVNRPSGDTLLSPAVIVGALFVAILLAAGAYAGRRVLGKPAGARPGESRQAGEAVAVVRTGVEPPRTT